MPELTVEEMPTDELTPYARNAKIHTSEQVDQIAKSIDEFGFNDPVGVWDGPDGDLEIVEGHGRVLAAKKLGLGHVPVIRLDHLSDEQRRAYALAHNKLTINTGWDFAALDAELGAITSLDMEGFGFDLAPSFDAIDDLIENDFTSSRPKEDAEVFTVSFVFPGDRKEAVVAYIKSVGKDSIAERIVEEAAKWE